MFDLVVIISYVLRPSDVAPRSVIFDPKTGETRSHNFCRKQIKFLQDGSCQVTFLGIKNDTNRAGFIVKLPKHPSIHLDPVSCLALYLEKTGKYGLTDEDAVFVSLQKPFKALSFKPVPPLQSSNY